MKSLKKSNKNNPTIKGKVTKILKARQDECGCDEAYIPFIKSFARNLLAEAETAAPAPVEGAKDPEKFTSDQNAQDFKGSLEDETDENEFDTQGTDPNVTANAITAVQEWSGKLDEFAKFMNDPNTQSLHKILAGEDRPGSLLRGVTRKASDSITRIAGEIEKLKEVLNSFIIMAPKKQRDADQLKMA
jgi:hypothetical protein